MLSGVYRHQRLDRRLLKWSFKAKVKCSLKCYTSEIGPAKFLVLLLVKYCLDGTGFPHTLFTSYVFKIIVQKIISFIICKQHHVKMYSKLYLVHNLN